MKGVKERKEDRLREGSCKLVAGALIARARQGDKSCIFYDIFPLTLTPPGKKEEEEEMQASKLHATENIGCTFSWLDERLISENVEEDNVSTFFFVFSMHTHMLLGAVPATLTHQMLRVARDRENDLSSSVKVR
jgi:hypothetical protein